MRQQCDPQLINASALCLGGHQQQCMKRGWQKSNQRTKYCHCGYDVNPWCNFDGNDPFLDNLWEAAGWWISFNWQRFVPNYIISVHVGPGPTHMSLREGNFGPILSILKVNGTALSTYTRMDGWIRAWLMTTAFKCHQHSTYTHPMYLLLPMAWYQSKLAFNEYGADVSARFIVVSRTACSPGY